MANTSFSTEYTDFATATVENYGHKYFQDVISRASPFMAWMMDNDGVTGRGSTIGGSGTSKYTASATGRRIEEPIMTELNTTPKWYSGTETFDVLDENVGTAAFFDAKQLGCTVTISGEERRKNKGEAAQINLIQAKTKQGMISIRNDFATSLIGSQGSNKEMLGLGDMVPTDAGVGTAYAEVAANTSFWLTQRSRTAAGTAGDMGDFTTNFRSYGKRCFHDCTEGTEAPDLHLVSQELMEAYDELLKPYERTTSKKARDLGFDNIMNYMGIPVLWDRKHPTSKESTQQWYMLNSEYLYLRYIKEANFSTLGFQRPSNADYVTTPVIWQGAFTTNNRRMHGILTGITGLDG